MKLSRHFARASHWTFTIKPIKALLGEYVGFGKGWIDPYAGKNSPAEITNDINQDMPSDYHMDAREFCKMLSGNYVGVLFDPPYSYRQVKEHYEAAGVKPDQYDTSYNFYSRVMNAISPKIQPGGLAISFGWNSNGFGKKRGFEIIEIMLVAHGLHHNDTIVTVERKSLSD